MEKKLLRARLLNNGSYNSAFDDSRKWPVVVWGEISDSGTSAHVYTDQLHAIGVDKCVDFSLLWYLDGEEAELI